MQSSGLFVLKISLKSTNSLFFSFKKVKFLILFSLKTPNTQLYQTIIIFLILNQKIKKIVGIILGNMLLLITSRQSHCMKFKKKTHIKSY